MEGYKHEQAAKIVSERVDGLVSLSRLTKDFLRFSCSPSWTLGFKLIPHHVILNTTAFWRLSLLFIFITGHSDPCIAFIMTSSDVKLVDGSTLFSTNLKKLKAVYSRIRLHSTFISAGNWQVDIFHRVKLWGFRAFDHAVLRIWFCLCIIVYISDGFFQRGTTLQGICWR